MSINYSMQKCECGGKLAFDETRKVWVCAYCGYEFERDVRFSKVQIDGMPGYNNMVRQTLLDCAYLKLSDAERDLSECEKNEPSHIGTAVVNLAYWLTKIGSDAGALPKIRIYAQKLLQTKLSDEELALYDFCESNDVYASLLVAFDTIGDSKRAADMISRLDVSKVFSPHVNKSLLALSLHQKKYEWAAAIANNTGNIDKPNTLTVILASYPDQSEKSSLAEKLFTTDDAGLSQAKILNNYFKTSADSIATKEKILSLCVKSDVRPDVDIILNDLLPNAGIGEAASIFSSLCALKLTEEQCGGLLNYCISDVCKSADASVACLESIRKSKQYIRIDNRTLSMLLGKCSFDAQQKLRIMEKLLTFDISQKNIELALQNYLLQPAEPTDKRLAIAGWILKNKCSASIAMFENYLLKVSVDENQKPAFIEMMLASGLKASLFMDLLGIYLLRSPDSPPIRESVIKLLINREFKLDSKAMEAYVCNYTESQDVKEKYISGFITAGFELNPDLANKYLVKNAGSEKLNNRILDMLLEKCSYYNINGVTNYLLHCPSSGNKLLRLKRMSDGIDLGSSEAHVQFAGYNIKCNLLQAYILLAADTDAESIASYLSSCNLKTGARFSASGNGFSYNKMKAFMKDNAEKLSPLSARLWQSYP
jgi:hypothetical protein